MELKKTSIYLISLLFSMVFMSAAACDPKKGTVNKDSEKVSSEEEPGRNSSSDESNPEDLDPKVPKDEPEYDLKNLPNLVRTVEEAQGESNFINAVNF